MNLSKLDIDISAKEKISSSFDADVFPHAVLLTGASAKDRRKTADTIACAMVCTSDKVKPCMKCPACIKAKNGNHPDITVVEGNEKRSSIPIDTVKDIRRRAYILPNEADVLVFEILEASGMAEDSQNSLLKILEEPPSFVRFILGTKSRDDLLETVLSRTAHFPLTSGQDMASDVQSKKGLEAAEKMLSAIAEKNEYKLMLGTSSLLKDKNALRTCLAQLTLSLRNALVFANGLKDTQLTPAEKAISEKFNAKQIIDMINVIDSVYSDINKNANENLLVTRLSRDTARSF